MKVGPKIVLIPTLPLLRNLDVFDGLPINMKGVELTACAGACDLDLCRRGEERTEERLSYVMRIFLRYRCELTLSL
jgi:hypothetical protein